jgi:hypothetical protein
VSTGKRNRQRGDEHELEVKKAFQAAGFDAVKTGAFKADDIKVALGAHDLTVECKRRKNGFGSLYKFLEQGDVVVHRADRKDNLITMPLALFLGLAAASGRDGDQEFVRKLLQAEYDWACELDRPWRSSTQVLAWADSLGIKLEE